MAQEWVRLAGVQEQAEAGVRQAMISMGRYTDQAFEGIKRMASALQQTSTFGDEAILIGTKFLLTYKQIPESLLPRTMKAMVDLAAFSFCREICPGPDRSPQASFSAHS